MERDDPISSAGQLNGTTALVTGASRGIGRRIAVVLALAGADVALVARPDRSSGGSSALEAAVTEIEATGGRAIAVPGDVSDADDVGRIVDAVEARLGRIDILVNNAATRLATKLLDTPVEDMERIYRVNVLGPFLLWKAVVPGMIERGRGNVINLVSTNAPHQPFFGMGPYRMSKVALTFLSVDLADELVGAGVAVNALDPGPIVSEGTASTRSQRERLYDVTVPYHAQDPVEVIDDAVVWLANQSEDTFTGQVVRRIEFRSTWGPGVSQGGI